MWKLLIYRLLVLLTISDSVISTSIGPQLKQARQIPVCYAFATVSLIPIEIHTSITAPTTVTITPGVTLVVTDVPVCLSTLTTATITVYGNTLTTAVAPTASPAASSFASTSTSPTASSSSTASSTSLSSYVTRCDHSITRLTWLQWLRPSVSSRRSAYSGQCPTASPPSARQRPSQ